MGNARTNCLPLPVVYLKRNLNIPSSSTSFSMVLTPEEKKEIDEIPPDRKQQAIDSAKQTVKEYEEKITEYENQGQKSGKEHSDFARNMIDKATAKLHHLMYGGKSSD